MSGIFLRILNFFDGTIADNIARFSTLDPEKVIEAARRVGIHEMVLHFPKATIRQLGRLEECYQAPTSTTWPCSCYIR